MKKVGEISARQINHGQDHRQDDQGYADKLEQAAGVERGHAASASSTATSGILSIERRPSHITIAA